ncbi:MULTISPECIES: 30S ribosomal protein S1 [unclassified Campylobacter]|uniref:30S ribosomal protein S1 n=1 Tax=unclassified Campylobacter TaxID=2593542 RepID=UPI001BDB57BA|nr:MULTISPECIES: 30S ribosomal protein S1 [unclassified Campylobacter]MBZ7975994.1 30S ribosomal protein S1 [Campylobacter sp. RM12637]MBZ7978863.1 30S ribosomal protein S1 [Campylobacter sp. RM12654]MBZ7979795.1 30S ribosomal protein S1 [Campylobacter sp. RM12642]MBZ7982709.1 30S ribosomal protein S1 [Campylobacter sp. RM12640]MBZ7983442.1 30S ribosomal protein S1 [Campylobacter sp. RM12647]MBZ7988848.1 30S ribosomal protein S1 [Campylobacter sp. RM12635]MBZ7990989.1 30S ribosomal protein S
MAKLNGAHNNLEDLENIDFAAMLDEFESEKNPENISVIDGKIIKIEGDEVFVDIQDKSEGVLNISEITKDDKLLFNVDDVIKVTVVGSYNGRRLLSYKKALRKEKVVEFIKNYNEDNNDTFEVKIIGKNRGGFVAVDNNEVEFFLPKSQCSHKEINTLMNKKIKVKILKIDEETQSIVVSKRKANEEDRKKKKELINNIINDSELKEGVVRKLTSYGMFVDIGGVDGLVHYSEISYKGPVNPSTLYKEGDKVLVKIVGYDEEKKHISLSIKAALSDPWDEIKDSLEIGDILKVVVSNIENYGAFVDLGNDIEGFLHISEISWDKNVKNPRDYLKEGQEIDVEVIEIDYEKRRLRVSLKNLLPKPFDGFNEKFKAGDIVEGEISTITNFGAFVKIDNIEGLLLNDDISWTENETCKKVYKVGDKVKVKIRKIDSENQKISLSVKHLEESPSSLFAKEHRLGDVIKGIVSDIKDFGVFVKVNDKVEALIKNEDLGEVKPNIGDEIEGALIFTRNGKIRLSIKKLNLIKTREDLEKFNSDDKITIGDIIKDQLQ